MQVKVYSYEEFDNLLAKISNDGICTFCEVGEWGFAVNDSYEGTNEEVYSLLSKELGVVVTDVILDAYNAKVAIIFEQDRRV